MVKLYIFQTYQVLQFVSLVLNTEPKSSKGKKLFGIMMYSNLVFIIFFVALIIKCVSFPCSNMCICNTNIFVRATLFLIFTNCFQDGLNSFFISDTD